MSRLVVAVLVVLALGQAAAALAIWFRHAIPRSPVIFRILSVAPLGVAVPSALAIAWMLGTGEDALFGLYILAYAALYFGAEAAVWWALNAYAVYYYYQTVGATDERMERIEETLGRMEDQEGLNRTQQDTDRGEEQTDREEGREHRRR